MRYSKVIIATLPVFLAGCLDVFDSDSDTFYTQPAPPPQASVPSAPSPATGPTPGKPYPKTGKSDCGCGDTATPMSPRIPSSALPPSSAPVVAEDPNWMPTDGQLVQAGDFLRELQHKKGGAMPSHEEMAAHLRSHMPLTASQVEKIMEELGVGKHMM
jgi:hypothetical protein